MIISKPWPLSTMVVNQYYQPLLKPISTMIINNYSTWLNHFHPLLPILNTTIFINDKSAISPTMILDKHSTLPIISLIFWSISILITAWLGQCSIIITTDVHNHHQPWLIMTIDQYATWSAMIINLPTSVSYEDQPLSIIANHHKLSSNK